MDSDRNRADKKGSILTIKSSENEPERRKKSATLYSTNKNHSHTQPKDKAVVMARWRILKEVSSIFIFSYKQILYKILKYLKIIQLP